MWWKRGSSCPPKTIVVSLEWIFKHINVFRWFLTVDRGPRAPFRDYPRTQKWARLVLDQLHKSVAHAHNDMRESPVVSQVFTGTRICTSSRAATCITTSGVFIFLSVLNGISPKYTVPASNRRLKMIFKKQSCSKAIGYISCKCPIDDTASNRLVLCNFACVI